ncbi:MAG: PD-(D/E)XK nuclease family protein [Bryobacterales bacterium]|nr:PD-(D/E)XK nuclease family protein [Bryobacterales bacterium]
MARRRITAASYESLLALAHKTLPQEEAVVLAPTRSAGEDLLRGLPGPGVFGGHVFTLPQFAARLAAQGGFACAPLSQLSQQALTARTVFKAIHENRLGYFNPVADRPGFIRALSRTIGELRLQCVDWAKLKRTGPPGEDLAWLGGEYERQLAGEALADLAGLYAAAVEVIASGVHPWHGLPVVLWDVPLRYTLERELVEAVIQGGSAAWEFGLEAAGAASEPALERVRRYLFAPELPPRSALDETVSCFSAPGEGLECVEIVRRVQALGEAGTPFDRIAVLLRAPERYQTLVEEAFRRGGVPVHLSHGGSRPDAAGRAFLALLVCALENCSAARFAEYLSLAQVPRAMKDGAPQRTAAAWTAPDDEVLASFYGAAPAPEEAEEAASSLITPAGWERLIVDAAVVGGVGRWRRRLQGLTHELRFQRASIAADDEDRRQALDRRIERLHNLERFALPVIELLAGFPAQASWGAWLDRLTELAETALRWPDPVVSVLRELRPMDAIGPVTLDEVYGVLEDRLRFLLRDPATHRYGRVFVSSIEEARGRTFDVVFLPGLAEGIFPRRAGEDPLLLDVHRVKVEAGLATKDDRVAEERELLRIAAAAAGRRLVFSYPRIDVGQARPRVPSFYALEIMRAAEGGLPDLKAFEKRAASATRARLGWPAPEDRNQAIDDIEYDLARIAEIRALPAAARTGKGRYLVEANAILARALRTHWRRWSSRWTQSDGMVAPGAAARAVLDTHRLNARAYSATALQQFATCPYRFFLYAIHQLREREEAAGIEQLDPLTRGALFHKAQHELFVELRRRDLLPLRASLMPDVLDLADKVLDEVAGQYAEELAPAIPRVWKTEIEDIRSDLRGWLHDSRAGLLEWMPLHSEFGFDTAVEGGFRLRGAVDLIEEQAGKLRVTDHKTGKKPVDGILYTGRGKVLQPLLYSLAVEAVLKRPVLRGRLYYCTHRGGYDELEIVFSAVAKDRILTLLETIDQHVETGFLPAAPEHGACQRCEYRAACGSYEEQRVAGKPAKRLDKLEVIRGME